jgi:hypothetical protein
LLKETMMRLGSLSCMLVLLLAACATGVVSDDLVIETVSHGRAVPGASCSVQTAEGMWDIVSPAVVPVRHTRGDLRVVCEKPGYRPSEVLYRGMGYGGTGASVGLGAAGGAGNVGFGLGIGVPLGGGDNTPARIYVEMNPL